VILLINTLNICFLSCSTFTGPLGTDTKDDECADHYQYFSFNGRTIITIIEMPENESSCKYNYLS